MISRYSISFWLLNLSTLLFFFSFNVIIPEMPDYISSLGGEDFKGFIIGVFTVVAAISRPISGKLTDTIGRIPIMLFGGTICIVVSFLYPWFATVFGFLMLRFFHGMSTGFMPTGTLAYLADIIPSDKRGEAMGIVGIMNNVGFIGGNACSSWITQTYGIDFLFYTSGLFAILSVAVILKLKESLHSPAKFSLAQLKISKQDIYDKRATEPAILMILTTITFGAMLTLIPDYSKHLGIENKGLYFSVATGSTLLVRLWGGKLSDRIGRLKTCMIGTSFWLLTTLLLMSLDRDIFFLAAVTTGIATGLNSPAVFAWAVDVANGVKSGRAMATLFISLEIGIATGAFLSAAIYGNSFVRLQWVFGAMTFFNVLALLFLINKNRLYNSVNQ